MDPIGAPFGALAAGALILAPFVILRPNRIAAGAGVGLTGCVPAPVVTGAVLLLALVIVLLTGRVALVARLLAAGLGIAVLFVLLGLAPGHLVAPGHTAARVSPASGFWLALLALSLLAADALARLEPGPLLRLLVLATLVAAGGLLLGSGWLDGLSILAEYRAHADRFASEAWTHLELAAGSVAAAVAIGLPLGIACARVARLRAATLPILNVIQTIPSIAMFGLMMVPLGVLATRLPVLAALGVRGIGTAPAALALVLYALLPVVANTVAGLDGVPEPVREAARGMGMTGAERLWRVELPLATPVILAGIRIVLVQTIGLVTIAALIGGGGLGTFVFQGLGQAAIDLVLLGTVPIVALAIVAAALLDVAIDLLRRRVP